MLDEEILVLQFQGYREAVLGAMMAPGCHFLWGNRRSIQHSLAILEDSNFEKFKDGNMQPAIALLAVRSLRRKRVLQSAVLRSPTAVRSQEINSRVQAIRMCAASAIHRNCLLYTSPSPRDRG